MNIERIRRIYIVGICGTAMASLAGLFKEKGYEVCGSDANVYPPMSTQLEALGIRLFSPYAGENLRIAQPDLVIVGNAVPRGNPEVETILNERLLYCSLPEALKEFFLSDRHSVVVAGTHGKTTTASLAAWLLESAGLQPSFLVGGVPQNFGRSFQWNSGGVHFVIEGDEYDTGFMDRRPKLVQYFPEIVILNPVEHDHADLYPTLATVEDAFWQFIKVIPGNGLILVNRDSEIAHRLAVKGYSKVTTFGFHQESDFQVRDAKWDGPLAHFKLNEEDYSIPVFGKHNVANAAAVVILGKHLGIENRKIAKALAAFQGVKRRMELRGEIKGIAVYDDFAHHPTAVHTTLEGARLAFPDSRIWGIFEPRSWSSRRNIFQEQLGAAFRCADIAIIAGVFEPEKLAPEVRLNPDQLVFTMKRNGTDAHSIPETEELIAFVLKRARSGDKLILMSNGSFDGLHDKLLHRLKEQ